MSEEKQKQIFSKNLLKYVTASNKTQKEIADAIQVSPQTFNTWCQGIALPRMGKVQALADYFHITKSDLIDDISNDINSARVSKISILQRAEENEKLSESEINDILSYAKFRYPNAFNDEK